MYCINTYMIMNTVTVDRTWDFYQPCEPALSYLNLSGGNL